MKGDLEFTQQIINKMAFFGYEFCIRFTQQLYHIEYGMFMNLDLWEEEKIDFFIFNILI